MIDNKDFFLFCFYCLIFFQLYLFESIFRISSGLNPLVTQTLFERAVKQQNSSIQIKEGKIKFEKN